MLLFSNIDLNTIIFELKGLTIEIPAMVNKNIEENTS